MKKAKTTYGSMGWCGDCCRSGRKLHGVVKGVMRCMACYSRERMKDPAKHAKQMAAIKRYRAKKANAKRNLRGQR